MKAQHTPGPWKVGFPSNHTPIYGANNEHVAWLDGSAYRLGQGGLTERGSANARLIAAAPEMLALLAAAIEVLDAEGIVYGDCTYEPLDVLSGARALLARIDGDGL